MAGVGLIVKRTGARVLPVVIEGTPDVELAWSSLVHPSRATVRVLPTLDYSKSDLAADEIARDLQARYADWTGWRVHSRAEG
jgi:hypothetical protein